MKPSAAQIIPICAAFAIMLHELLTAPIGGYRVECQTQCVTVGIRTRCPTAPVSRLARSIQRPLRALAIDNQTDQGP